MPANQTNNSTICNNSKNSNLQSTKQFGLSQYGNKRNNYKYNRTARSNYLESIDSETRDIS